MNGAGVPWVTAVAAAGGLLAVHGVALVVSGGARLPRPVRAATLRLAAEVRETVVVVRGMGVGGGPLPRAAVARLRVAAGLATAVAGWVILGTRGAVVCAAAGAWSAPRLARARRARHARRLDAEAPGGARAIADAIAGGASLRRSVTVAARRLHGQFAHELARASWELEMGAGTAAALERLRHRSGSRGVGLIVAAMQVQHRAGGDLPGVLRGVARALEEEHRVLEEARAATAQARFTAAVVIALPTCAVAMGALASPGLPARLTGSALGVGLLAAALSLQACGALVIRRLAAPDS